jgi:aminoglycoside 6'-N-acetyltransferase I
VKIRAVEIADLSQWAELRVALWPEAKDGYVAELMEFFTKKSNDIAQAFVLGNDAQRLIGFIEINIRQNVIGSCAEKVPYIEGWYVDSEYRNQKLGEKLMLQAQCWALEQGYTELASDVEENNSGSIRAHPKLGFKETERIVCFIKQL